MQVLRALMAVRFTRLPEWLRSGSV